jgi:1,4-dihydroxy-2-naphthoyl-CoA hydrolase
MAIWQKNFTLESLNALCKDCMLEHIGIKFTSFGDDYMEASMPVVNATKQPFGMLHGGASVVLAETLASVAGNMACAAGYSCLGLEINANHLSSMRSGEVFAKATPLHIGATTQVWNVEITNERGRRICISRTTLAVRKHMKVTNK